MSQLCRLGHWCRALPGRRASQAEILLVVMACVGLLPPGLQAERPNPSAARSRPNIILIMADDMGSECLNSYGGTSYKTPQLDRIAQEGIRFEHCYSTPICTTSRVQLMTGKYNFRNYEHFGYLNPRERTFGHLLQEAGYETMIAGKWQLNGIYRKLQMPGWANLRRPLEAGFDEAINWQVTRSGTNRYWGTRLVHNGRIQTLDPQTYTPDYLVDRICQFISKPRSGPFFVYYPMLLTHAPFIRTPSQKVQDPSKQQAFADMVGYTDHLIGKIDQHLEREGISNDTMLIFTTDNGTDRRLVSNRGTEVIPGGKALPLNSGTHVPLIVKWKGHVNPGQVSTQLVDFTDFLPTLVEAAGGSLPTDFVTDGISFLPALEGKTARHRSWVFCHYDCQWGKFRAVQFAQDDRYKLYRDGRFYDLLKDREEQNAISGSQLSPAIRQRRQALQSALDQKPPLPAASVRPGPRYPSRN